MYTFLVKFWHFQTPSVSTQWGLSDFSWCLFAFLNGIFLQTCQFPCRVTLYHDDDDSGRWIINISKGGVCVRVCLLDMIAKRHQNPSNNRWTHVDVNLLSGEDANSRCWWSTLAKGEWICWSTDVSVRVCLDGVSSSGSLYVSAPTMQHIYTIPDTKVKQCLHSFHANCSYMRAILESAQSITDLCFRLTEEWRNWKHPHRIEYIYIEMCAQSPSVSLILYLHNIDVDKKIKMRRRMKTHISI